MKEGQRRKRGRGEKKFKQRLKKKNSHHKTKQKWIRRRGDEIRRENSGSAARTVTGELGCEGKRGRERFGGEKEVRTEGEDKSSANTLSFARLKATAAMHKLVSGKEMSGKESRGALIFSEKIIIQKWNLIVCTS